MSQSVFSLAAQMIQEGKPCALVTVIRTTGSVPRHAGSKMLVDAQGTLLAGTIGGGMMESRALQAAAQVIQHGAAVTLHETLIDPTQGDAGVCGGTVELFVEPLLGTPTVIVAGAGHVGRALVHLAKWSGFRTVLTDDRPELCTPESCPGADVYRPGPLAEQLAQLELNPQTYIALVTRGVPIDVAVLPMLLQSSVAYIGVIGSRRRWATSRQTLLAQGVAEADLNRVHAPIGLEIQAETPEEIAVSIVAEMIAIRRGESTAKQPKPGSGPA